MPPWWDKLNDFPENQMIKFHAEFRYFVQNYEKCEQYKHTDGFCFSCVVVANVNVETKFQRPEFLTTSIASIRDAMLVVRNLGR